MLLKHFKQERQVAIRHVKILKDSQNSWELCVKKLICNEVERCQSASLRKKLFHTPSFMYFAFIFSECITITSSQEGLKVWEYNFFQRKVILLVIYLFNHDSPKSSIFMLNVAFDILLSAFFLKYSKLESFVSCNLKLFALFWYVLFLLKPNYSPSWW